MRGDLRRIWHPAAYQGGRVRRRYFEGWYLKLVDAAGERAVAIIPGVSYSPDGTEAHAFVQVATGDVAHYFSYPITAFDPGPPQAFDICVGPSSFSASGMTLRLADDTASVTGDITFGSWGPWPVSTLSPGAMGPFRFVPRMEAYHGVLSMDHEVSGRVVVDSEAIDFTGGRGYVEKDWGHSFPSSWIWAQTNTFERPGVSLMTSVARIPWMTGDFTGTITGFLHEGTLHRFATYTGARLVCVETEAGTAHVVLRDRRRELELEIVGGATLSLKAPVLGAMEGRDAESLGGTVGVTLRETRGGSSGVIYRGRGRQAGVEVMNDRGELALGDCL